MLKFGFRKNNFYPLMLLLFIFLRICVDKILKVHPYKKNIDFVISFLIFFSQSLIGGIIFLYYYSKKNKTKNNEQPRKISLTFTQITKVGNLSFSKNKPLDLNNNEYNKYNKFKKIVLIIFASFFNFIGSTIRSSDVINFGRKEENNSYLEIRIRSIQIIISSLLCYFTLRLGTYKHQKLSLIVITIVLIFIITLELVYASNVVNKIISMLICIMSCLSRAFMDVTEKYLFDYDYINILTMLIYEGLIGIFFFIIFFISNKTYQNQGRNILKDMSEFDWSLASFILLIILYTIISGFRNAYRVTTNKYYSPMSRALFESTLDPFLFLYNFLSLIRDDINYEIWIYFSLVLFGLFVIAFFSLIYNDFIILNCCGLAYNTYSGINSRLDSDSIERKDTINSLLNDNDSQSFDGGSREGSFELKDVKWKVGYM